LLISLAGKLGVPAREKAGDFYSLSELATAQMCQKLEIPVKYYRRFPYSRKSLAANYDVGHQNGNSFL
jgi:hypothetical protein